MRPISSRLISFWSRSRCRGPGHARRLFWRRSQRLRRSPAGARRKAARTPDRAGDAFVRCLASSVARESTRATTWNGRSSPRPCRRCHAAGRRILPSLPAYAAPADCELASGDVIRRKFTIVEGWSSADLRAALAGDAVLEDDVRPLDDSEIMVELGRAGVRRKVAFCPNLSTRAAGELSLLDQAAHAMDAALAEAWDARAGPAAQFARGAADSRLHRRKGNRHCQRTTADRRRLRAPPAIGMRLQTDPTVIYGMGSAFDGNIRKRDLETDTPYNTYTRIGLPPTPIAMPGKAALPAAAHPAAGDALFFVATWQWRALFLRAPRRTQCGRAQVPVEAMMAPMKHRGMLISDRRRRGRRQVHRASCRARVSGRARARSRARPANPVARRPARRSAHCCSIRHAQALRRSRTAADVRVARAAGAR